MAKIGVVGTGMVGSTAAYSLIECGIASELVLIDYDARRAEGEAMDLSHAVPFHRPCTVRAGDYADLAGSSVVILAAGVNQKPGETRLELVGRNAEVFKGVVPKVVAAAPGAILLVATNPVDILTQAALAYSGLPPARVIGSGTVLDTARFRALLGRHFGVDPRSVHAYIIGEHGDSEVAVFSSASIAGVPLRDFAEQAGVPYREEEMASIFEDVRTAAYQIIERKRATYYGIGSGLARLVEAIVRDQGSVHPVSNLLDGQYGESGVCLSLPGVLGADGLRLHVTPSLDDREADLFRKSAAVIRDLARSSL